MAIDIWRIGSGSYQGDEEAVFLDVEYEDQDLVILSIEYRNATPQKAQLLIRRPEGTTWSFRLNANVDPPFSLVLPKNSRVGVGDEGTEITFQWPAPQADAPPARDQRSQED